MTKFPIFFLVLFLLCSMDTKAWASVSSANSEQLNQQVQNQYGSAVRDFMTDNYENIAQRLMEVCQNNPAAEDIHLGPRPLSSIMNFVGFATGVDPAYKPDLAQYDSCVRGGLLIQQHALEVRRLRDRFGFNAVDETRFINRSYQCNALWDFFHLALSLIENRIQNATREQLRQSVDFYVDRCLVFTPEPGIPEGGAVVLQSRSPGTDELDLIPYLFLQLLKSEYRDRGMTTATIEKRKAFACDMERQIESDSQITGLFGPVFVRYGKICK